MERVNARLHERPRCLSAFRRVVLHGREDIIRSMQHLKL